MKADVQQPTSYPVYTLALLTLAYTFNFIDRQILVILQESIKADMGLSDLQLGLLSGFAFAAFYVLAGFPIAVWADRGNRRNIVAWAVAAWSVMTALCGLATNFIQLLLARIGVAVGESGCSPPAHSIISDSFPPARRGTMLAIYSLGVNIGVLLGYLLGGWINTVLDWRMAFIIVGVPGIAVAALIRFTLKEPPRSATTAAVTPMSQTLGIFLRLPGLRWTALAAGFAALGTFGTSNFMPSFLIRLHGMDSASVGMALAAAGGLAGGVGTFLGGYLGDRLARKDIRWYVWLPGITTLITFPLFTGAVMMDSTALALLAYALPVISMSMYIAPTIAVSHAQVAPQQRAMASAMVFFMINLVGLGAGPMLTGALSDGFSGALGREALRYALICTSLVSALACPCYLLAARHIRGQAEPSQ